MTAAGNDSVKFQVIQRVYLAVGLIDQPMPDHEWPGPVSKERGADLALMSPQKTVRVADIEFIVAAELINNSHTAGT